MNGTESSDHRSPSHPAIRSRGTPAGGDAPTGGDVRQLIEEIGTLFEAMGHTRMEGRVVGYLLVAEPPVQALGDIAAALEVTKGSVSTATRALERGGLLERIRYPGDRRDHFRIPPGLLDRLLDQSLEVAARFRQLLERALALTGGGSRHAALQETHDFYVFLEGELRQMTSRWQERKGQREVGA